MLACAGSLDRGVEGKQIDLACNIGYGICQRSYLFDDLSLFAGFFQLTSPALGN